MGTLRYRIAGAVLLCLSGVASGQTLAQKNWAGSGVQVEPWWRRAVFYRIDAAKFQDSDGDGKGDLGGVAQRLDYLQTLGVDAVILDASGGQDDGLGMSPAEGFDDLARAAVGHHLRLIVTLGAPASQAAASDVQYLAQARSWLNQGAAGLYVPTRALQRVDGAAHIGVLLHQLRLLTNSFPGGRVLIAGAPSPADMDVVRSLAKETELAASAAIAMTPTAAGLRSQMEAALAGPPGTLAMVEHYRPAAINPLLPGTRIGPQTDAAAQDALERTQAAMLLASRAAVILEYGQELGLTVEGGHAPVMQWTPTNVTPKPPPPAAPKAAEAPVAKPEFESFHPFVPPPKNVMPPPRMPLVIESDDPQPQTIDPNSLPGFTAGTIEALPVASNGATANVALEQTDPKSLLNFYRQLIQLHHDNAAVRNGTQTFVDRDAYGFLMWLRRAPVGSKSSATVVVVCKPSGKAAGDAGMKVVRELVGASGDVVFIGEGR